MVHHANELRFAASAIDALHADWVELGAAVRGDEQPEPEPLPFRRAIRFEGARFAYAGGAGPVLRGVDLEIPRGSSLGIVGPTGAGKSTLLDLLLGLLAPDAGRITVDGVELAGRERAWQRQIGYVPQAVHLLDASVRRNVAFGVPEPEIDDARVREALALAQLADAVAALPQGAETRIGERGLRLSGGERARLALARALYRDPELLVLDVATAALDHASERAVARALEGLARRKPLVVVAHRATTVMGCDRIALLADGRVADQGSWAELAERHPELRPAASA
jgi:ABC-type multidrug transport system fused ATPase/permease subunit